MSFSGTQELKEAGYQTTLLNIEHPFCACAVGEYA